jgi:hypothetical protein
MPAQIGGIRAGMAFTTDPALLCPCLLLTLRIGPKLETLKP